jgi:hypothetical protein
MIAMLPTTRHMLKERVLQDVAVVVLLIRECTSDSSSLSTKGLFGGAGGAGGDVVVRKPSRP